MEMSMSERERTVGDDAEHQRFLYQEDGLDAQLVYRLDGNRLILVHTEVPDALAGRGIGGSLVRAAAERAETSGETLVPWCSYARKWLVDHSEVAGRVDIDWDDQPLTAGPGGTEGRPEAPRPAFGEEEASSQ
jgi:predicted GNAT family acetyltransferase